MAKISKNQLRRQKAKQKRQEKLVEAVKLNLEEIPKPKNTASITSIEINESDPTFLQFKSVFEKFQVQDPDEAGTEEQVFYNDGETDNRGDIGSDDESSELGETSKLSRRQQRIKDKIPLAVLKAESSMPEIVEWYDADAPDPRLLVYLKSLKNVVQVPSHWTSKREYLSNKRAIDRPPFQLPKFIEDTGISDMRDTLKEDDLSLKEQMRLRVQPKMGKLDLNYDLLHNAFFKQQTKPRLYGYGDMYYEGKEYQSKFNFEDFKPGKISAKLSNALGIPYGSIPPWVPAMKKYGLPPSYPNLRVPGLNATVEVSSTEQIDMSHWAELEPESEEEEEEEEEEEDDDGEDEDGDMIKYEQLSDNDDQDIEAIPITEFGTSTTNSNKAADGDPEDANRPLYQVLEQQDNKYALPSREPSLLPTRTVVQEEENEDEDEDEKFVF